MLESRHEFHPILRGVQNVCGPTDIVLTRDHALSVGNTPDKR